VETENITFELPETLISRLRDLAENTNQSVDSIVQDAIEKTLEADRLEAARRLIERLRNSPNRGIGGKITWTRDELYDR
jgi:predicted DNA-binding protein